MTKLKELYDRIVKWLLERPVAALVSLRCIYFGIAIYSVREMAVHFCS